MDEDSLRNWGYYEPSVKGHLGLQLMSSMVDRNSKPVLSGRDSRLIVSANSTYNPQDSFVTEPPVNHMDFVRDSWINHREKFLQMFPANAYNSTLAESSESCHPIPVQHQPDTMKSSVEESSNKKEAAGPSKKRSDPIAPKGSKAKRARKHLKENGSPVHNAKTVKKKLDIVINGVDFDISSIPVPVCSCTGTPQQCYRWGCGGWQSACCTMTISMYPLPMSTKRRGARIAGRKMSQGAFKKVLEKLSSQGYDFASSIDLRLFWAKHGTNKFVTIR